MQSLKRQNSFTFYPAHPTTSTLHIHLHRRPRPAIHKIEVIHSAQPQQAVPSISLANMIHQASIVPTKVVRHHVPTLNAFGGGESFQRFLTANVLQMRIIDVKDRREHRGRKFAAVGAVAHHRLHETEWSCGLGQVSVGEGVLCGNVRRPAARRRRNTLLSLRYRWTSHR